MIFRNSVKLSRSLLCLNKNYNIKILVPNSYSFFAKSPLSTKPVELSYTEFQPDVLSNSTPLVVLHGFLGSKQNWRSLGKVIAKKSGRQVFALDARNHGDSPHSDDFSLAAMCEDVKHFLSQHAIEKIVLVGHSMGGRTAMKFALSEKLLVDKLVVIDASPVNMPESSSILIPSYMKAMKEALTLLPDVGIVQARKLVDEHLSKTIPEIAIRQFLLTNLVENNRSILWKANLDVLMKTFQSQICDFSAFNGCFMGETLFICGGESPYVKVDDYPLIREIFPKANFIVVPGAGHWVHSDRPAEFLEALIHFL